MLYPCIFIGRMMHSYNVKKFEHFENTVRALVESEIVDDQAGVSFRRNVSIRG